MLFTLYPECKEDEQYRYLEEPGWQKEAEDKPSVPMALKLLHDRKICNECYESNGSYLSTPKCPGLEPRPDFERMLRSKGLYMARTWCRFITKKQNHQRLGSYTERCGLTPEALETLRLDTFTTTKSAAAEGKRVVGEFLDGLGGILQHKVEAKPLLYIHGNRGSGKSHLAIATAQEIWERYTIPFCYWYWPRLATFFTARTSFKESVTYAAAARKVALFPYCLVLDSLEASSQQTIADTCLMTILNERLQLNKVTILTSRVPIVDEDSFSSVGYSSLEAGYRHAKADTYSILHQLNSSCVMVRL